MSGLYKTKQQVLNDCWGMDMRRRCLESVPGRHQSLENRKTAPDTELEIVVASCGLRLQLQNCTLESN